MKKWDELSDKQKKVFNGSEKEYEKKVKEFIRLDGYIRYRKIFGKKHPDDTTPEPTENPKRSGYSAPNWYRPYKKKRGLKLNWK